MVEESRRTQTPRLYRARKSLMTSSQKKSLISLVGRPNVGKSSLFNALAGKKKALVLDYEGVTRDRKFETVVVEALKGKKVQICDTGGWRPENWRQGRDDREMLQNIE